MKSWSNLANIVYRRTYARRDSGVLENWEDTIDRVVEGNIKGHNVPESEVKDLIRLMKERKAIPAGRGLWFSGSPSHAKLGGAALNNCWYLNTLDWQNFIVAQDLLMLGGGVGLSVEHRFTSKLPKIKPDVKIEHKATRDADFIIPDSREGWCELTRRALESFFVTGRSFTYSTVCLRGSGELIKGFGGTASGPLPLIKFIENLCRILNHRQNHHVRPIDAADILTAIGEMVVSGNVRRSAIIILGDPWDKEYLVAKRWDLGPLPSYRSCANYSVVVDDIDDLHPLYWKTFQAGEAFGIVNRTSIQKYGRMGELKKDTAQGVNPCQPEFATVLTPEGIRTFRDIGIGSEIWSGKRFTTITSKVYTGEKPVFSYSTRAGVFIGTENHKVISDGERVEVGDAQTIDTSTRFDSSDLSWEPNLQAVVDGLVIGDGSVHHASNDKVFLVIGENDSSYFESEIKDFIEKYRPGVNPKYWEVTTTITAKELPKTYERRVPKRYKYGKPSDVASFLRGLYSANGSIVDNRVTLKSTSIGLVKDVQEMLSSIGIRSYYTVNMAHEAVFSNGPYVCKESYDLNTSDRGRFDRTIGFLQLYKNEKLRKIAKKEGNKKESYPITDVCLLGTFPVWDITVEAEEHTYWTGGLLVSNCAEATLEPFEMCNLQEIALPNVKDEEEFILAARLMHRYGKRVTLEHYHHKDSDEVVKKNRRIGTGITGCLSSPLFNPNTLDRVYDAIQQENKVYSKKLGIPESIRTTVVKPSGTVSKILDMGGYEGIHAPIGRYMIQRIRFAADDSLIPLLKDAGHYMEPVKNLDGGVNPRTLVVDFYVEAPKGCIVENEGFGTERQLETLLLAQKHWADQAVSTTVYYDRKNISQIKEWLANNIKNVKSISFMARNDHGFVQAPKEAISKEQFEKLSKNVKPIDTNRIEDGSLESQECANGVCPVK